MTNPVIFKHSVPIALLTLVQSAMAPVISGASLALIGWAYQIHLTEHFPELIVIVMVAAAALLQPDRAVTPQIIAGRRKLVMRILVRWMILLFSMLALGYATKSSDLFARRVVLTWAVVTPGLIVIASLLIHDALRRVLCDPANARRAAFVGYNEISLALAQRLKDNAAAGLSVAGFFDDRGADRLAPAAGTELRGGLKDIVRFVKERAIDVLFVALPVSHIARVKLLLEELRDTTVSVYYVPTVLAFDSIQGGTSEFLGVPLIALCETPFHGYRGVSKRLTDVVLASAILLLAMPLMLVIAALVRWTSPGPVIFRQRRYGLDGQEIVVYKFRTMVVSEDGEHVPQATRDDWRITPLGRILRRSSLDELPQLINVLQGRMSLVGPRPHAVAHNEIYRKLIKGYMVRHKVVPGMTGLAQVHGHRGETASVEQMEARLKYDLEYLRNWSPLLDLKILVKTLSIVARGDKAY